MITLPGREPPSVRQLRWPRQKQLGLIPGNGASLASHYHLKIKRAHLSLRATTAAGHHKAYFVPRQVSFYLDSHVLFGVSAHPWKETQPAVIGSKVYKDKQKTAWAVPKPALLPRAPKSPHHLPAIAINTSSYLNTIKVSPCEGSAHSRVVWGFH